MKGKTLALLALTAATAFTASAADNDRKDTKNSEFLAGYANTSIKDGDAKFNGFNFEYRHFLNDYFGFGGLFGYGADKISGVDLDTSSIDANALAKFPIGKGYIYGKAGLSYTMVSAEGGACNFYGCYVVKTDDSDVVPVFGVGLNFPIKERLSVDVSYSIKKPEFDFGSGAAGKVEMRTFMAQVGWKF